ncbi:MAG TPA: divalent-cation tolerance protein CutA [Steroidobacteraceae bacterium]|nr:divalent-cation tolerance protein CutA [Steroidobacteraceae bacterium]
MDSPGFAEPPGIVVLCTCPDPAVALELARTLVREGLVACVNCVPGVQSIYRWEGRICEDREQLLVMKTTPGRYEALEMRLKTLHPYEIPEIIALPVVAGSRQYLDWLGNATTAGRAPSTE